ncbi:MAG: peptide deformylase [Planctomycetota bacterium]
MAILPIVLYPTPVLMKRTRVLTAEEIRTGKAAGYDLRKLAQDMLDTMYDAPGIGLAAPQVGVGLRLHVMDISVEKDQPMVLLNPKITAKKGGVKGEEGCLSFPKIYGSVRRAESIEVEYMDLEGAPQSLHAEGLKARCLQHEIDHLDGILFIDKMSATAKFSIRKDIEELRRNFLAKNQAQSPAQSPAKK